MRCHFWGGPEGTISGNAKSTGVEHLIRGQKLYRFRAGERKGRHGLP